MYFEYVIPKFLQEYKFLYLLVFGLYLSTAYWVILFLRDQAFFLIKSVVENVIMALGEILIRFFDLSIYLIKSPISLLNYCIRRTGKDFDKRKNLLLTMAQVSTIDELREHIFSKLDSIEGPADLDKLEASIRPFFDNIIYSHSVEVVKKEEVGIDFALADSSNLKSEDEFKAAS